MDSGRLGVVRRQENSRRKFVFMLNDVMRSQYEVVDECLSREKFEIGVKYDKSFVSVRRSVVRQRVLQQCLKMKREAKKLKDRNLGLYGGKPLYTFSRDIEKFIAENHPKLRRQRQAEKALRESIDKGKILDPTKIPKKIEQYFDKNWKEKDDDNMPKFEPVTTSESKDIFKNNRHILPPLRGIINPFHTRQTYINEDNNTAETTRNVAPETLNQPETKNITKPLDKLSKQAEIKSNTDENNKGQMSREPTKGLLILPPILQTKQMAQR